MKRNRMGLTLIELLTVVAIIAILAAILLPYAFNRLEDSRISRTEQDISSLKSAVALFLNDNSTIPTNWNNFVSSAGFPNWRGPYINKAPNTTGNPPTRWVAASAWRTDYRIWTIVNAGQDHRFGSSTNLYPFRNAIALEIENPIVNESSAIPITSLQKIDADMDNDNASSGFIIEAREGVNPFITSGNVLDLSGQSYTGRNGGQPKSMYILLFTY